MNDNSSEGNLHLRCMRDVEGSPTQLGETMTQGFLHIAQGRMSITHVLKRVTRYLYLAMTDKECEQRETGIAVAVDAPTS